MPSRHRLVVKREHPARRRVVVGIALAGAVGIAVALVAVFLVGERWGGYWQFSNQAEKAKISRALAAQSAQNLALKSRVAFLERSLSLANASVSAMKASVAAQQGKQLELEQKLAFYQKLMQPAGGNAAAVRIAGLQLLATGRPRRYRFQIILVRADGKTSPPLTGSCKVEVNGMRNGKEIRLPLKALAPGIADPLSFTLRYFTNLSGALILPAGFVPEAVEVSVQTRGEPAITGTYSWPVFRS